MLLIIRLTKKMSTQNNIYVIVNGCTCLNAAVSCLKQRKYTDAKQNNPKNQQIQEAYTNQSYLGIHYCRIFAYINHNLFSKIWAALTSHPYERKTGMRWGSHPTCRCNYWLWKSHPALRPSNLQGLTGIPTRGGMAQKNPQLGLYHCTQVRIFGSVHFILFFFLLF